jgi:hypothetical protein
MVKFSPPSITSRRPARQMNDSSSRVCTCGGGPLVCGGTAYSNIE